jgi:hypothetical protein
MRTALTRRVLLVGFMVLVLSTTGCRRGGGRFFSKALGSSLKKGTVTAVVKQTARESARKTLTSGGRSASRTAPRTLVGRLYLPLVELKALTSQAAEKAEQQSNAHLAEKILQVERCAASRQWGEAAKVVRAELRPHADVSPEIHQSLERLRPRVAALASLQQLRDEIARSWEHPPDGGLLEQHLAALSAAGQDAALVAQSRTYLGCRAVLEGHPEAAGTWLPAGRATTAEALLRDLKAVAPGEAPAPPVRAEAVGAPALGSLPVPEAPPISVRPSVRESLRADLPAVEGLAAAEKQARGRLVQQLEAGAENHANHVYLYMNGLRGYFPVGHEVAAGTDVRLDEDNADAASIAAVAGLLGRKVTPVERIIIHHLRSEKSAEEIATAMRETDTAAQP